MGAPKPATSEMYVAARVSFNVELDFHVDAFNRGDGQEALTYLLRANAELAKAFLLADLLGIDADWGISALTAVNDRFDRMVHSAHAQRLWVKGGK